jgi:arginine exporter protein ArgO
MMPVVAAPVAGSQGCVPGQLEITSPKPGAEVGGTVTLVGTVYLPNFGFYKYEVALRGTDNWSTISAQSETKKNEELGILNTTVLTPGDYLLRVVVLDNSTQIIGTCIITIRIKG